MLVTGKLRFDRRRRDKLPLNGFEVLFDSSCEIQEPVFILPKSITRV